MWGYVNLRQIEKPRQVAYVASFVFMCLLLIGALFKVVTFGSELATIIAAFIGSIIALETLFIQSKLSLKYQLNVKAIEDITKAMNDFQTAAAVLITFRNDFVVVPQVIPPGFWYQKSSDKYMTMQNHMLDIRMTNKLYNAVESNEIAVIHLGQYYTFVAIQIEDLFTQADSLLKDFLSETSDWNLTEEQYKTAVIKFDALHQSWTDIAAYYIDLRKLLQNELLGNIFGRKLLRRKPKPGFGTTLDETATYENVSRLVEEREAELLHPTTGSSTTH